MANALRARSVVQRIPKVKRTASMAPGQPPVRSPTARIGAGQLATGTSIAAANAVGGADGVRLGDAVGAGDGTRVNLGHAVVSHGIGDGEG